MMVVQSKAMHTRGLTTVTQLRYICNVLHHRVGHTTEWVKIPSGLPSTTNYNNNNTDTQIILLGL